MNSKKLFSKPSENNKQAICEVLQSVFHEPGLILEIGSGSGQHAVHMAAELPHVRWQASDTGETIESINAYRTESGLTNLPAPLVLNVLDSPWPLDKANGVFSANTAHIMSWQAVEAMFAGVARLLGKEQNFCLYGPFNYNGKFISDGNARLDAWAKSINPESGIRDYERLVDLAGNNAMQLVHDHAMPANNRILQFAKE